jgi:hypothetical protein
MRLMTVCTRAAVIALLCLASAPLSASAADEPKPAPEKEDARVRIALFGSKQSYSMSGVNSDIEATNKTLQGSGFELAKVQHGSGFGAGIRVRATERLWLLFDWTHLAASSSKSGVINQVPVSYELALPANGFTATAGYFRPWHAVHYGVGGGLGYYFSHGHLDVNLPGQHTVYKITGKGPGFQALGMTDVKISTLHFEGAFGYRYAKTTDLETDGSTLLLDDGSKEKADWNGLLFRIGFSIPFDHGTYRAADTLSRLAR